MSDIEARVRKIVADQLGVAEADIKNESSFVDDLGADSLDTVELVMALEEDFGTEIPDDEAEKITTVQLAIDYAKQRKQFGRPIADFQMVQSMIAEMYVWVESMRLFTYQTLRAANSITEEEGGRGDIHKLTAEGVM